MLNEEAKVTPEATTADRAISFASQTFKMAHKSQVETVEDSVDIQDNESKILIPYTHSRAQVWDPQVTDILWKQHRITGQLVGALPRLPHQSALLGLPLSLMSEEVKLLQDEGIGVPVTYMEMKEDVKEEIRVEFQRCVKRCQEEQVNEAKNHRKREIELMADKILDGKRKKFEERKRKKEEGAGDIQGGKIISVEIKDKKEQESVSSGKHNQSEEIKEIENISSEKITPRDNWCQETVESQEEEYKEMKDCTNCQEEEGETCNLDREKIIEEEVAKIKDLQENMQVVEIFTQNPLISWLKPKSHPLPTQLKYTMERTRYAVFRDLWHRGYHMTQGLKFGGDFLAYSGDPHLYHACFIIRCVEDPDRVSMRDLVAAVRTAAATKKTFVLAAIDRNSVSEDNNCMVKYRSYQWAYDD
ncbi:hypothetical protein Pcinc_021023 [Petrolisthes cinctipes]|uniref:tRNA-intron lyase n=1 Tax=Petrolisthes cinctipes TaxID=88211 RepID=A0AAE1FGS2_PETCI|nr:hypothetical protein Pcinc_021023 [Petrolisthes cinctipes]